MVSVIVPVYNAEKNLEKCIMSILNQSYQDLELILINDGSKDGSGKICKRYAERDKRIRYIERRIKVHRLQGTKGFLWLWDSIYSLWTVMIILKKIWWKPW